MMIGLVFKCLVSLQKQSTSTSELTQVYVDNLKTPAMVCAKHWPLNPPMVKGEKGKHRPRDPPSLFEDVPVSKIPTPPPKPRSTKRSSFEIRTMKDNEFPQYKAEQGLTFESLKSTLQTGAHQFNIPVTCFVIDDKQWIQSNEYFLGIPSFCMGTRMPRITL